jgi:hypothetical protein
MRGYGYRRSNLQPKHPPTTLEWNQPAKQWPNAKLNLENSEAGPAGQASKVGSLFKKAKFSYETNYTGAVNDSIIVETLNKRAEPESGRHVDICSPTLQLRTNGCSDDQITLPSRASILSVAASGRLPKKRSVTQYAALDGSTGA